MAIEIFNRYEKKYKVNEYIFVKLQNRLSEFMEVDSYNKSQFTYPICNIYYDTCDSQLIRASLSKPMYKEKLRVRSYGTANTDSKVYVEIKKKINGLVNKRRSGMKLQEAYNFLESGEPPEIKPYMNSQVMKEIQYLLSRYDLKPKVYLSYERRAYFEAGNPDLRISFDTNIITRHEDMRLESGIYGSPLLSGGEWLMEIKTSRSMPVWLTQTLSEYKIYPSSFSKYGADYQRNIVSSPIQAPSDKISMIFIPARKPEETFGLVAAH
ncbi:MAG: polyphosphate polymerase domain-containing protein [Clostridiales bacterium]|jgi:hypothetical protein|nr:polyphosphate polymerase domain-containing protein [Clostridiales bacterium]